MQTPPRSGQVTDQPAASSPRRTGGGPVAVAESHPLAAGESIAGQDLAEQPWVASRAVGGDPGLGVWPGLGGRPRVVHSSPDWLTKLQLVATGAGLTAVPQLLLPVLPRGVRALPVVGGSHEQRQVLIARVPGAAGTGDPAVRMVADALRHAMFQLAATIREAGH